MWFFTVKKFWQCVVDLAGVINMKKFWDQVEIGHALNPLVDGPISRTRIAQFAAASDDFSPLNLDEEYAKSVGYGSVFAPSIIAMGLAEETVRSFAANMGLISLSGTFQRLIWPGDILTSKGVIVRRYQKNGEYRVQFSLWVLNQNVDVVMKGQALCSLFKNAAQSNGQKLTIPAISALSHENLIKKCEKIIKGNSSELTRVPPVRELA
jgi:acyl dehydratase